MKKILLYSFFSCIINIICYSQIKITSNILFNVFLLQSDTSQGSGFLVQRNGQEFVVTAKHLFRKNISNGDSVSIIIQDSKHRRRFKSRIYLHYDSTVDVAVLKLPIKIGQVTPFQTSGGIDLGQDVYFLGYPNFSNTQFNTFIDSAGFLPLIKKGIFSGAIKINRYHLFFIDGQNNAGFSGGPVINYDYESKGMKLFGIISGYFNENKFIRDKGKIDPEKSFSENSGIMYCYPIDLAIAIIMKNFQ